MIGVVWGGLLKTMMGLIGCHQQSHFEPHKAVRYRSRQVVVMTLMDVIKWWQSVGLDGLIVMIGVVGRIGLMMGCWAVVGAVGGYGDCILTNQCRVVVVVVVVVVGAVVVLALLL